MTWTRNGQKRFPGDSETLKEEQDLDGCGEEGKEVGVMAEACQAEGNGRELLL